MKRFKHSLNITLLAVMTIFYACGGSGGDDTPPPLTGGGDDDSVAVPTPEAASLLFPDDDTECNEGTAINDLESTVTFQWNTAVNTDSYSVVLTNLNTNDTFNTISNTNEATIAINRGTPYEWHVTSRANGTNETSQSETWRFYNQGPGIENYAPFPAEAINPTRGSILPSTTVSVVLQWSSSDVDNDIVAYELFFGNQKEQIISIGITTETSVEVDVISGSTYFWQVLVIDDQDNASTSQTFEFQIE